MIRIEGVTQNGKKVWCETNDVTTAKNFINRLERFEYKQATKNVMGVEIPAIEAVEDNSLGGTSYVHAKVPKAYENSGR